ncbi:3-hydroxyacyl-CoA dehydrogenase [Amycolatopsis taiwanensis]|uniref:3-hydroxyacyl-CoA dehydrogenase n=1 Tax=Amycolatopsis taiwanensis TaxID=342230 RepID=UPI000480FA1F|nr:3-hydroxyacyl-CoA dehydrogenase [Amycolatopsis taiwanensis]
MTIAVAGAGSIGVAFALVFARAGRDVRCWDPVPQSLDRAERDLADRLARLDSHGLLAEPADDIAARVSFCPKLDDAVRAATLVQECAPERLELKRALFAELAGMTGPDVVLASSSSAIRPSVIAEELPAADRILVGHPGNPPYLIPVIEVVPSPVTSARMVEQASETYSAAGLHPVVLGREVEGFVFNRLQGALLREAYCLLRDGVASVEDIDTVVRSGLGRRWAVIGPFETVDLNTRGGIAAHAEKMGPAYARMGAERGQHDPWTPDLVAKAEAERRALLPLENWDARVRWRDEQLMALSAFEQAQDSH